MFKIFFFSAVLFCFQTSFAGGTFNILTVQRYKADGTLEAQFFHAIELMVAGCTSQCPIKSHKYQVPGYDFEGGVVFGDDRIDSPHIHRDGAVEQLKSDCAPKLKGVMETVTIGMGVFETCKITFNGNRDNPFSYTQWVGDVPMGIVKYEQFYFQNSSHPGYVEKGEVTDFQW